MNTDEKLPENTLRNRSIRGGAVAMVGQAIRFILTIVSQIFLARLLDPAQFGVVALVAPVIGLVGLFADFGLVQAVVQQPRITQPHLSAIFFINISISLLLAVLVWGLSPLLAWFYHDARLVDISLILGSLILVTGTSQLQGALANRHLKFAQLAVIDVVSMAVAVAVGITLAWNGFGYWSLIFSQLGSSVSSSVLLWFLVAWRPSKPSKIAEVLPMLRFGGYLTATKVVGYLNMTVDNVLIGTFIGEAGLGIYDRAWKLAVMPLNQIMTPMNMVAVPSLARLDSEAARYGRAFVQMMQALLFVATPVFLFGTLASGPLVLLVLGSKWEEMVPVFSWVCLGALISPLNTCTSWLFVSQGRSKEQMKFMVFVSAINIVAYIIGLRWGLVGVAGCSAISVYILQTPILVWSATRQGPVNARAFLKALFPFFVMLCVAGAILEEFIRIHPLVNLLDLIIAPAMVYTVCFAVLCLLPSGRVVLSNFWRMKSAFGI
jgi:polysaccharide transporter, PST family